MKKQVLALAFAMLACIGFDASAQVQFNTPEAIQQVSQLSEAACATAVDRCAALPTPKACPLGQHWTTLGSGLAHCVLNDPVCTGQDMLMHDSLGNPSCVPPVITSQTQTIGCAANYSGSQQQTRTMTTAADGSVTYGPWATVSNSCTPNPVTCTATSYTNTYSCPAGYGGSDTSTTYVSCPSGAYGTPSYTEGPHSNSCSAPSCPSGQAWNGSSCASVCSGGTSWNGYSCVAPTPTCPSGQAWNGSSCASVCSGTDTWNGYSCVAQPPVCTTHQATSSQSCPLGQVGTLYFTNTVDCNGNVLSTTPAGGSCAAAPAPTPPTCPRASGPNTYGYFWEETQCGYDVTYYIIVNNVCTVQYGQDEIRYSGNAGCPSDYSQMGDWRAYQ